MDEKRTKQVVTFWLSFFVWQRKLFMRFFTDLFSIIAAFFSKVVNTMKKTLYIVAKPKNKRRGHGHDQVADQIPFNIEEPPQPETPPVIINTSEFHQEDDFEDDYESDAVIRMEISHTPPSGDATLIASLHVATMEKLNTLVDQIQYLQERTIDMALNLEALTAEVSRVKTVHESAVALIHKVTAELESISAELASKVSEPPIDTSALDALVSDLKSSTDSLAAAVAETPDTHTVVLNADNPTVPTVEVTMPAVLPPVVEATVEPKVETVDPASPEPQLSVTVEEAAPAVVDAVEATPAEVVADPAVNIPTSEGEVATTVIPTDEGQTDVTVVTDPVAAEAAGTDAATVLDSVSSAFESAPEVTAEPEAPAEEAAPVAEEAAPVEETPPSE